MPTFEYKILGKNGVPRTETGEGPGKKEMLSMLESQGYMVLSIKEVKGGGGKGGIKFGEKIKPEDISLFTDQLATMLKAGVPLVTSLEAIHSQVSNEKFKGILYEIIGDVNSGYSLSVAMQKHPRVFDNLYVNMIHAGEEAGVMDTVLNRLSSLIESDIKVKQEVKSAMRYPIIVLVVLILAFVGAMVFIIPAFMGMLNQMGAELPLPTRIMIATSDFMRNYWWLLGAIVAGIIFGFKKYINTESGRLWWDGFKMKAPVFGNLISKSALSRFAHMMRTLSQSGIQIVDALKVVAETTGNAALTRDILEARKDVIRGNAIAESLRKSKYFSKLVIQMIDIGEQSGSLEEMMGSIAKQYDRDVDYSIKKLSSLIEPIMVMIISGFLLIFALGIFLPMWNMSSIM
ncbi:MAG: type II secretion system F family protein [Candidatus Neomarinimicrobiota bacterium]|nr:MAG: type II secretion system F family protein [Candidatus Neomarinimicrobiota bacterium]